MLRLRPVAFSFLERVAALEPSYARGVRRVLARGGQDSEQRLVGPVDAARERLGGVMESWRRGEAKQRDVIQAHNVLVRLMEKVSDDWGQS